MSSGQVTTLTAADRESAIAAIVAAFVADPVVRWFLREPRLYLTYFPLLVSAFGGRAFEHGSAYGVDGHAGAALWLPPGVKPDRERMGALMREAASASVLKESEGFAAQQERLHPTEPHWYLPLIGVDPARQGNGYGSALLSHALAVCDRDGLPAYLEATTERSAALYARHGFEKVGEIQSGSSPPMSPMLRRPKRQA